MKDEFNVNRVMLGGKIDPLSEIRNAGIVTNGSVFWVKQVGDADYTTFQSQVGIQNTFGTIQSAVDKTRNDKNDYVLVTVPDSNAVYTLGTALDLNKSRIHVIGVGYSRVAENYAITLRGFATTAAGTPLDSEMINVVAGGVELAGMRLLGTVGTSDGGTVTNGFVRIGTASSGTGHDLWMHDFTIESGQTVAFGTPALVATPGTVHSARFDNVSFLVPNDTLEKAHAGLVALGNGGKRWRFNDCTFQVFAGSTADRFVTAGTGAKEFTLFRNTTFVQTGTVAMASAFVGSVTVGNPVLSFNHVVVGTVTQLGTDPTVYKAPVQSGTRAIVYDQGIAVGTALLVAA